jgi:tetratricopeptide (TPR) repeat protein
MTVGKLNAALGVLLGMLTIALYSPASGHAFLAFDDEDYVTGNAHIREGLSWNTVRWAFTSTSAANWHPLTWLSHALDYQLFGLNPAGHHLHSVLLHALNAVLLFLLLAWGTKRVGASLLVAALFAVHPLNVESVAWVAERKNVLSTFFFLWTILAYGWYARKPGWRRYLLVAALFVAGLMAKPMVITLPFVLLLLDYWPLGRIEGGPRCALGVPQFALAKLFLEKLPLLFLSVLSAVITLKAQRSGQAVRTLQQFPLGVRIENAVVSYGLYLWKMLWPTRLAPLYPHPGPALPVWQVTLFAIVLTGLTLLVMVFRGRRYLLVGWLWFLGTLIPVIGLVQVGDAALADRYVYIPLIGIFIMIAWSLNDWAEAKELSPAWRVVPPVIVLAGLSLVTVRQLSYWENDYTVWAHTLVVTERNSYAHDALGSALMEPDLAPALSRLDNLYTEQKRMEEALGQYEEALKIRTEMAQQNPAAYLPIMASTLNSMGNLDRLLGRTEEARERYEEALKIHRQLAQQGWDVHPPDLAMTLTNLGFLERLQKRPDEAYPHFEEALKIYRALLQRAPETYLPDLAMTLNNLGISEKDQNRLELSRQHYEEALKIRRELAQQTPRTYLPDVAMTLNDLGNLDGQQNQIATAQQHYEEALTIYRQLAEQDPDKYMPFVAGTLNNLGFLENNQRRIEESRAHYAEALSIYQTLAQNDAAKYAGDIARVQGALEAMKPKAPAN